MLWPLSMLLLDTIYAGTPSLLLLDTKAGTPLALELLLECPPCGFPVDIALELLLEGPS